MRAKKTILRVGKYHSPDGVVDVTPDRLKHWQDSFSKMKAANLRIPVGWDHSNKPEETVPVAFSRSKDDTRSAKDGVGYLSDFKLSKDGNAAEITLDIRDAKAAESVKANSVQVSPIIYPEWKDGKGNEWSDVFTHVDLVHHPVDADQSDFVACSLRQVAKPSKSKPVKMSIFRLASDSEEDEVDDEKDDKKPMDDEDTSSESPVEDVEPAEVEDGNVAEKMSECISLLSQFDPPIIVPQDVSPESFFEHFCTAAATALAGEKKESEEDQQPEMEPAVEQNPQYAAMSQKLSLAEQQASAAHNYAQSQYRLGLKNRLDALVKSGKCSPAELQERSKGLGAVKLSLGKDGKPEISRLEDWIESRETLPAGAVWDEKQRLSLVEEAPKQTDGKLSREEAEEALQRTFIKA